MCFELGGTCKQGGKPARFRFSTLPRGRAWCRFIKKRVNRGWSPGEHKYFYPIDEGANLWESNRVIWEKTNV